MNRRQSKKRVPGNEKVSIIRGRFSKSVDEEARKFSASHTIDRELYFYDIQGSIAHARMLKQIGVLTANEFRRIQSGLKQIQQEIEENSFVFSDSLEDIHMHIESRLIELTGDAGRKLHTGRSRNDQVALDLKLYCKESGESILVLLKELMQVLLTQAIDHEDVFMPAYTHLQQAQMIRAAHHFLAYLNMFDRDFERIKDCLKRMDFSPLGSGALAGTGLGNDRFMVAKELGFSGVTENSMDSVSDRDFALELLFDISLIGVHLSRFSEEIVIWFSEEFGLIELDESFCTGSSLMPQKSNPDIAELIRGKSGRFIGNLINLLVILKGLPLTYNRDLQEDKAPVFDSVRQICSCLRVFSAMLSSMKIKTDWLSRRKNDFMLATDVAEFLVKKGLPFRKAHEITGALVQYASKQAIGLNEVEFSKFQEYSPLFDASIYEMLDLKKSPDFKNTYGSPSKKEIRRQINYWKKKIK